MVSAFSLQTSLLVPDNGARRRKRLLQKANAAISTTGNRSTKQEPAFRNCLARASCRCSVVCIFTSPTANPVTCVPASQQTCRSHLKASAHTHTHVTRRLRRSRPAKSGTSGPRAYAKQGLRRRINGVWVWRTIQTFNVRVWCHRALLAGWLGWLLLKPMPPLSSSTACTTRPAV